MHYYKNTKTGVVKYKIDFKVKDDSCRPKGAIDRVNTQHLIYKDSYSKGSHVTGAKFCISS